MSIAIKNIITTSITLSASTNNSSPDLVAELQEEDTIIVNKLSIKLFIRNLKDLDAKIKENVISHQFITAISIWQKEDDFCGKPMKLRDDRYTIFTTKPIHEKDYVSITVTMESSSASGPKRDSQEF
jgi:hypothetical protein